MTRKRKQAIGAKAKELLERYGVIHPPVDVDYLATQMGASVVRTPFTGESDELSGFIFRDGKRTVIGVNDHQHKRRQRFTVAHELGHYLLHDRNGYHVDRTAFFRSELSSQGTDQEEVEANHFAAELLMPRHFLERDLAAYEKLFSADQLLGRLAKHYEVSQTAMAVRLTSLGFLR